MTFFRRKSMKRLPNAVHELVYRYFGSGALPDYSQGFGILARDPYLPLRERLHSQWGVEDMTDVQYDLSCVWALLRHEAPLIVRASFVGPYAIILENHRIVTPPEVVDVLESEGFEVLSAGTLEAPVNIWSPEVEGSLYEFLFEFDNGIPWIEWRNAD